MRKLCAIVVVLAIPTLLPTTALAQPRWYRGAKPEVTVYVEKTRVGAANWHAIKLAGIEWGRSSRLHVVFVNRCPSRYYCVKVYDGRWSGNRAGWATLNYDPKTNYAWYGSLHLNNRHVDQAQDRLPRARPRLRPGAPPERADLHARRLHHPVRPPGRHRLRQPAPGVHQGLVVRR